MLPGSLVGGIGPTPPGEPPHHRAARERTPDEDYGVHTAKLRRKAIDRMAGQPGEIRCPDCGSWMATWLGQFDDDPYPDMPHGECRDCDWKF